MDYSTNASPSELLELVCDKDSFLRFLRALSKESDMVDELQKADPEKYLYTSVIGWENGTIGNFLDASAAWLEDQPPEFRIESNAASLTWKEMAEIFYAGKIYE